MQSLPGTKEKVNRGGCNTCGTRPTGCWDNPEWAPRKNSDRCYIGGFVVGCQYSCEHDKYLFNVDQCCLGKGNTKPSPYQKSTCHPSYFNSPSNPNCSRAYSNMCGLSNNLLTDPRCDVWCENNKNDCNRLEIKKMQDYCKSGKIFNDSWCQLTCNKHPTECRDIVGNYCRSLGDNMLSNPQCMAKCRDKNFAKLYCDHNVINYCSKPDNIMKEICSCFDSDDKYAGQAYCFNPKCHAFGYKTSTMDAPCADICQSIIKNNAGRDVKIDELNVEMNCAKNYGVNVQQLKEDKEEELIEFTDKFAKNLSNTESAVKTTKYFRGGSYIAAAILFALAMVGIYLLFGNKAFKYFGGIGIFGIIFGIIVGIIYYFRGFFSFILDPIRAVGSTIWNAIKNFFQLIINTIRSILPF